MKRENITFNTGENKLVVTFTDESSKEYTDSESYLADWPDRAADCIAMNWPSDFPSKHDKPEDYEPTE
jgi:hypothetical protein